ncbi:MAG TPA: molybdenum cofactor guanylyltransferase [Kofleriaceae bacterium]|nr:molybdenum cofactor guanylyltransferase [Kofleriaceae bacterium]
MTKAKTMAMTSPQAKVPELTALILAGGRSRRLDGRNKALLCTGGVTLLDRLTAELAPRASRILVSVAEPAAWTTHPTVIDPEPGLGPLAGIGAGLAQSPGWLLAVAVDMPHLGGAVLDLLLGRVASRGAHAASEVDVVAFRLGGRLEPLVALWGPRCLPVVRRRLAARQLKVAAALQDPELRGCWIEEDEVRAVDPTLRAFANVNDEAAAAAL